jgi:hypothetical protein
VLASGCAPLVLSGFVPFGLLESNDHVANGPVAPDKRRRLLEERMISVVDSSVTNKPKPKTARSGLHQCNNNIVFGIDARSVKELRAMAKEQGYRNLSRLTKRELLGLLA